MSGIGLQGFNHTGIVVTDLDQAIAFFQELLGFTLLSRAPRDPDLISRMTGLASPEVEIAHLQGPGHRVELIHYRTTAGRALSLPKVVDDGAAHLALDVDDAEAAVEAARAHGLEPVGEVITIDAGPNKGRKVVYLASAYGLLIEFIETPPAT